MFVFGSKQFPQTHYKIESNDKCRRSEFIFCFAFSGAGMRRSEKSDCKLRCWDAYDTHWKICIFL
jgi:hypothetical protein